MPQVLIRDLEPVVIEQLKERAQQNGRSLEAELRMILRRAAGESAVTVPPELEQIRRMFAGRTFSDSAELIREDRER